MPPTTSATAARRGTVRRRRPVDQASHVGPLAGINRPAKPKSPTKLPGATSGTAAPAAGAVASPAAPPASASPPSAVGPTNPLSLQPGDKAATVAGVGQAQYGLDTQLSSFKAAEDRMRLDTGIAEVAPGTQGAFQDRASGRWFAVDLEGNPYSRAAQIAQEFQRRNRASRVNDAAGGFLFDGVSLSNDLASQRDQGQANYGLAQSFLDGLGDIEGGRAQAHRDALDAATGARAEQLDSDAATIIQGQGAEQPAPTNPGAPKAKAKRRRRRKKK